MSKPFVREVEEKFSDIDTSLNNVYTKTQIDTQLNNVYTKTQIDSTLSNIYTKSEIDNKGYLVPTVTKSL